MKITHNAKEIDEREWEELAERSPYSSAFQTPECYRVYAQCNEYEVFVTAVKDDKERLKGVVTGAIHKNGLWPFSVLTKRSIVFGGPLVAEDAKEEEVEILLKSTKKLLKGRCIYLEYRFTEDYSLFNNVFEKAGLRIVGALDAVVETRSREELWMNIQKRKRRQIKGALRRGVTVTESASEEEIRRYYPRVKELHWKVSHKPMPSVEFFVRLAESEIGRVMMVKHEGEVLGFNAALVLKGRKVYHLYSVGEDKRHRELAPSSVGLYGVLKWAAENGIKECDLMGAGVPGREYGVREFKRRMGARIVNFDRGIVVFNKMIYRLGTIIYG